MSFATEHGSRRATYTGGLLWSLIDGADLVDEPGKGTHLRHTILVHGADGHAVSSAVGELDPAREGKPLLVAYAENGNTIKNAFRLIVPNDKHGGRDIRDLVSIEVR